MPTKCTALTHLNISCNGIGTVGEGKLRDSWRGSAFGLLLEDIDDEEEEEEEEDEFSD